MTREVSIQTVSERIEYIESLNSRGVGTAVESQQFELACLRRLLAALTAQPVKLPEVRIFCNSNKSHRKLIYAMTDAIRQAGIEVQE